MNIWDILILAALGTAVAAAVVHLFRKKSKGCSGCCSECQLTCERKGG